MQNPNSVQYQNILVPGSITIPSKGMFLDICCGKNAPLAKAGLRDGRWVVIPVDAHSEWGGSDHDICHTHVFEKLLTLCKSGRVSLAHGAGPCGMYSRCRERAGGPPPVVDENNMEGLPGISQQNWYKLQTAKLIHSRVSELLMAVLDSGGVATWETPPTALTKLDPVNLPLLSRLPFKGVSSACRFVPSIRPMWKQWEFDSSSPAIQDLQMDCQGGHEHSSFVGKRNAEGVWLSSLSSEYPDGLGDAYFKAMGPPLPSAGPSFFLPWTLETEQLRLPQQPNLSERLHIQDGGGLQSSAVQNNGVDSLHKVRTALWSKVLIPGPQQRLQRILRQQELASPQPFFNEEESLSLAIALGKSMGLGESDLAVSPGQPFRLDLLKALALQMGDADALLPDLLKTGVPTGILFPIPPSGIWRHKDEQIPPPREFSVHTENWKSAAEFPGLTRELVQSEIDKGFMEELPGGLEAARQRWGENIAGGKLGVVQAPGKKPRLVGDSSISGANMASVILDSVENPSIFSVMAAIEQAGLEPTKLTAFSLDIHAAHKRILVKPEEQGFSVFQVLDRWVYYKVCHFGAKWSAFWWGRLASLLLRVIKRLLFHQHIGLVYVDDYLFLLPTRMAIQFALLILGILSALNVPLSLDKLQFGSSVLWTGFHLFFQQTVAVSLPEDKLTRIRAFLSSLKVPSRKVLRTALESGIGLLVWATQIFSMIRPWLEPLYTCVYKPRVVLLALDVRKLESLLNATGEDLRVHTSVDSCDIRKGLVVWEIGGRPVRSRAEIRSPRVNAGRAWVKFGDFNSQWTSTGEDTSAAAELLLNTLCSPETTQIWPLPSGASQLVCYADAWATKDVGGVGGWFSDGPPQFASAVHWFHIPLDLQSLPQSWQVTSLQSIISTLELLAQALLLSLLPLEHSSLEIYLNSDNMPTVGAGNKGISLKKPFCYGLQILARVALFRKSYIRFQHVSGVRNEWADKLSRLNCSDQSPLLADFSPDKRIQPSLNAFLATYGTVP